jgi:iron complex transport system substrate-binding protein
MKYPFKPIPVVCLTLILGLGLLLAAAWGASPIQDDLGQRLALKAPPQRIISLYGGLTEILIALGVQNRIVAHIQGDKSIENIPTVGTHLQPNVEMILALKPDLVVQGGVPKGMPALKKLEAEGVPVAMFAPHDFTGLFSTIQRLGALTGEEQAAAGLERDLAGRLQTVAARLKGSKPVRVFFEVRCQNLLAAGRGSIVNDIITRAGGVNVVDNAQRLAPYSLEALLAADPDV